VNATVGFPFRVDPPLSLTVNVIDTDVPDAAHVPLGVLKLAVPIVGALGSTDFELATGPALLEFPATSVALIVYPIVPAVSVPNVAYDAVYVGAALVFTVTRPPAIAVPPLVNATVGVPVYPDTESLTVNDIDTVEAALAHVPLGELKLAVPIVGPFTSTFFALATAPVVPVLPALSPMLIVYPIVPSVSDADTTYDAVKFGELPPIATVFVTALPPLVNATVGVPLSPDPMSLAVNDIATVLPAIA
jgi:hypothetical protein